MADPMPPRIRRTRIGDHVSVGSRHFEASTLGEILVDQSVYDARFVLRTNETRDICYATLYTPDVRSAKELPKIEGLLQRMKFSDEAIGRLPEGYEIKTTGGTISAKQLLRETSRLSDTVERGLSNGLLGVFAFGAAGFTAWPSSDIIDPPILISGSVGFAIGACLGAIKGYFKKDSDSKKFLTKGQDLLRQYSHLYEQYSHSSTEEGPSERDGRKKNGSEAKLFEEMGEVCESLRILVEGGNKLPIAAFGEIGWSPGVYITTEGYNVIEVIDRFADFLEA